MWSGPYFIETRAGKQQTGGPCVSAIVWPMWGGMRPCFPTYTGRPDKKRTAEGEQKVYVRSTRQGSGDSKKGGGEPGPVKSLGPLEPTQRIDTHTHTHILETGHRACRRRASKVSLHLLRCLCPFEIVARRDATLQACVCAWGWRVARNSRRHKYTRWLNLQRFLQSGSLLIYYVYEKSINDCINLFFFFETRSRLPIVHIVLPAEMLRSCISFSKLVIEARS